MLIQLTYASRIAKALLPDDLKSILAASQRFGDAAGVGQLDEHAVVLCKSWKFASRDRKSVV